MIEVLLVDDQLLLREAMKAVINDQGDFNVIDVADNGEDALYKIFDLKPDIVIANIELPIISGVEITERIKENTDNTKVILMTQDLPVDILVKGMLAGAHGILEKDVAPEELYHAIRLANAGLTVLADSVNQKFKHYFVELVTDRTDIISELLGEKGVDLTDREIEVANLLRFGLSNQQIANRLDLKLGTVKNYVSNIYQALNIHSRDKAITYLQKILKHINYYES